MYTSTPQTSKKPPLRNCDHITVLIQCGQQHKQTVKGELSTVDQTAYVRCPCCQKTIVIPVVKRNYLHQTKVIINTHTLTYVTYTTRAYAPKVIRQPYVS